MQNPRSRLVTPGRPEYGTNVVARALAIVALALLTAACGNAPTFTVSGGFSSSGGSVSPQSLLAFSQCVRGHGILNYPDPRDGELPKGNPQAFGVSNSAFANALGGCQHLIPQTGGSFAASLNRCEEDGNCPPSLVQEALNQGNTFAQCMRSHGVSNWPDPITDARGRPLFDIALPGGHGFAPGYGVGNPPVAQGEHINASINLCGRLEPEGEQLPWA